MYAQRTPRTEVMAKVKEDFDYAMANVRSNDGEDYVNKAVVATIASRCMLFEGTWYIYHKNDEAMKTCSDVDSKAKLFLEAAKGYAEQIINSGAYAFDTDFRTLFGTLYSRPSSKEIILYRAYNKSINNGSQHCIASYSNGNDVYFKTSNGVLLEDPFKWNEQEDVMDLYTELDEDQISYLRDHGFNE